MVDSKKEYETDDEYSSENKAISDELKESEKTEDIYSKEELTENSDENSYSTTKSFEIEKLHIELDDDEDNNTLKNEEIDNSYSTSSKIKEFITTDLNKKIPLLLIIGIAIGLIFVLIGILMLSGGSDRVVDNVVFGENAASSVFFILIGFLLIGITIFKVFSKKNIFGGIFNTIGNFESSQNTNIQNKEEKIKTNNDINDASKSDDLKLIKTDIEFVEDEDFKRTVEINSDILSNNNNNNENSFNDSNNSQEHEDENDFTFKNNTENKNFDKDDNTIQTKLFEDYKD